MDTVIGLGQVIAERVLVHQPTGGRVLIAVGTPRFIGKGWDWACPYVITGLGDPIHGHAHGIDALQSLQLVSAAIRADLEQTGATLSFLAQEGWHSAFPSTLQDFGSADLRARIEALIEAEQTRWLAEQGVRPAPEDC